MLVLARLQARGIENPYLDMRIEGGQPWKDALKEAIENANTFICILSPISLQSDAILEEIAWASQNTNMKYIFLTRTDWDKDRTYPDKYLDDIVLGSPHEKVKDFIKPVNWISISGLSARDYNNAMDLLLRDLGYAPR